MDYLNLLNLDIIFEISKKLLVVGDINDSINISNTYESFRETFDRNDLYYSFIDDKYLLRLFKSEISNKVLPWYSKYRIYITTINLQKIYMIPIELLKSKQTFAHWGILFDGSKGIIDISYLNLPGINYTELEVAYTNWLQHRSDKYVLEMVIREINDDGTYTIRILFYFRRGSAVLYEYSITEDTLKNLIIRLVYSGVRLYEVNGI